MRLPKINAIRVKISTSKVLSMILNDSYKIKFFQLDWCNQSTLKYQIEKQNTLWYNSTKLTKCLWEVFVKGAVIDNFEPRAVQRTIDQTNRNNLEKEKDLGQRSVLKIFIFLCKRKILTQSRKLMNSKIQAHF